MHTRYMAQPLLSSAELHKAWDDYNNTDSTCISTAADTLEEEAREVSKEIGVSYIGALTMIYETAIQRVEFGVVDRETGDHRSG